MKNWNRFSIVFLRTIEKLFEEILMQNWGEKLFSNRQFGMTV